MKKFKFEFEKILDFRTNKENKLREQLATATKRYIYEKNKLDKLLEMKSDTLKSLNRNKLQKINILQMMEYYRYLNYLDDNISSQWEIVKRSEMEVSKRRAELISARIDRKVIENLKEKKFVEYKHLIQKIEEVTLEDMVNFSTSKQLGVK